MEQRVKALPGIMLMFFLAVMVSVCGPERHPVSLVEVDSLAETNPRRAMSLLSAMAGEAASMPEDHLMYYRLLQLKAADKAYIGHTSDSIGMLLVDYYEGRGDSRLLPQAYYYAASVYRDLHDAPQALNYFQKAANTMPAGGGSRLKGHAYNQMGKLFMLQDLDSVALHYYQEAYKIESDRKDTLDMIASLCDMSVSYQRLGDLENCIRSLEAAENLNALAGLNKEYLILYRLSEVFLERGQSDSAWACIQLPLVEAPDFDKSAVLSVASKASLATGRLDSAYVISKELLKVGSIYARQTAARVLAEVCLRQGRLADVVHYINMYKSFSDSVSVLDARRAMANANALYDSRFVRSRICSLRLKNAITS